MARPQKCAWAHQAPGNRRITSLLACRRAEGPDSCCFSPALTADISCQLMEKEILNPRVSAIVGWSFWWPFRESSLWPGWPQGIRCAVIVSPCHFCGSLLCSSLLSCPALLSHSVHWRSLGATRAASGPQLAQTSASFRTHGGKKKLRPPRFFWLV